jgi:uncharacterized protein YbjT (DUF2867 family)
MEDKTLADREILVLGATGKTGRRVAERLVAAGHRVRIGSRNATPAFDWDVQATWGPALDGIGAVYVTYQPDLAVPGALETVRSFFDRALAAGVTRIVLLSGRGEIEAEQAEDALKATAADWTILRASWFCQNFSEAFFLDGIRAGELALPVRAVPEPFVDVEDIADVAFAALTQPGHVGRLYELTGPTSLTFAEAVAAIAHGTGRDIAFAEIPADDYRAALFGFGLDETYVELVMYLLRTVLDGRNVQTANGVQQALGRAPRSFADYVRRTAATGIWSA